MARRLCLDPSEIDVTGITWEMIFQETTNIPKETIERIKHDDDPPSNLHAFVYGTHEKVMKLICGSDQVYAEVESAVSKVVEQIPTKRALIEESFLSPSEYANKVPGYNHRFSSDLHVSLQVKAFGDFMDTMTKGKDEIESKYYNMAASLMQTVSGVIIGEKAFENVFLSEVKGFFPEFSSVSKGDATMAVTINQQTYHVATWEFKRGLIRITSDPILQNNACYIHLQSKLKCDRSPMLLLTILGCRFLQVFGVAWNGGKVCVDPLCSPVSLLFVPRDPTESVANTARVLAAIATAIEGLKVYYSRPVNERRILNEGPYFRDCRNIGTLENTKEMKQSRWLFGATLNEQDVVVKFIHLYYGEQVHTILASQQLAPQLILCEPLSGGWVAVVMEKVQGSQLRVPVDRPVKKALEKAVTIMHAKGYVHGDFFPQNILLGDDGRRIYILDFDWAGTEGRVRYPVSLNMARNWHKTVECGGLIAKEHDLYQLEQIKAS